MRFRGAAALGGVALAGHMVPSVVSLGQWAPIRCLPWDLCRWRGPCAPAVALTFDDGPDPSTTPLVLDRLAELGLRGTFFCLGSQADAHPTLVAEILARGHAVEAHGYRHDHHFVRTARWIAADLRACRESLRRAGAEPRWYRPPYGQTTGGTMYAAQRVGLRLVLWSAWGHEWDAPDAADVVRRVHRALKPGAIVLLHDTDVLNPPGSTQRVLDALGPIASELARVGLDSVTLDELVAA